MRASTMLRDHLRFGASFGSAPVSRRAVAPGMAPTDHGFAK